MIVLSKWAIGGLGMKNEVKYNNALNTLRFEKFTAMDYNVLMCLCYKLKNQGSKKIVLKFDELKQLTEFQDQSTTAFANALDRMIEKLIKVNAKYVTEGKRAYLMLFKTFVIDEKKKTLTVSVNEDFTFILNELSNKFTSFELKEFAELDSKYAKSLYKNLKQYKTQGWWKVSVDDLRTALDVPVNYSNKRIMGDILKPSLKLLDDKFDNLKCEPIKAQKRGAPIEKYYFTFTAEKQIKGQMTIADYPGTLPGEAKPKKKKTNFHKFEQNDISYDDLESALLDN